MSANDLIHNHEPSRSSLERNVLTSKSTVKVIKVTSELKGCPASNLLKSDDKALWMSEPGLP